MHRGTPIVIATSEAESSPLLQEIRRMGVAAVLKKPWKPLDLAAAVKQACAAAKSP